jgi:hypothetical protein
MTCALASRDFASAVNGEVPAWHIDLLPIGAILARALHSLAKSISLLISSVRRQRIFESGCTVEEHGALMAADTAVGEALFVGRVSGGAFRAQQEALPRATSSTAAEEVCIE